MARLTDKQSLFVKEYLIDLNATQAAIRAGYSENRADATAYNLLRNTEIQKAIQEQQKERNNKIEIDAEYVLRRLIEIDQMDVADILEENGNIKQLTDWPKPWRQTLSGFDVAEMGSQDELITIVKKIKLPDKLKNLELLGKHIGVQAFKDNVEHIGETPKIIINRPNGNNTDDTAG